MSPLYKYNCKKDGEYDLHKKLSDSDTQGFCPTCGKPGEKLLSPVGFTIRGGGVDRQGYSHPEDNRFKGRKI